MQWRRSYDLLVNKYGLRPEDIIFDPLMFPVGTGDEQYIGSAEETVEGIRLIKQAMPKTQTTLGISNMSFGLPKAGREVLNSVYLYVYQSWPRLCDRQYGKAGAVCLHPRA